MADVKLGGVPTFLKVTTPAAAAPGDAKAPAGAAQGANSATVVTDSVDAAKPPQAPDGGTPALQARVAQLEATVAQLEKTQTDERVAREEAEVAVKKPSFGDALKSIFDIAAHIFSPMFNLAVGFYRLAKIGVEFLKNGKLGPDDTKELAKAGVEILTGFLGGGAMLTGFGWMGAVAGGAVAYMNYKQDKAEFLGRETGKNDPFKHWEDWGGGLAKGLEGVWNKAKDLVGDVKDRIVGDKGKTEGPTPAKDAVQAPQLKTLTPVEASS